LLIPDKVPTQHYFYSLIDDLSSHLHPNEVLLCSLTGETSDFIRLNRNRILQAGSVRQLELSMDLIEGQRHAAAQCNLCMEQERDISQLLELIDALRLQRQALADDPFLFYNTTPVHSEQIGDNRLLSSHEVIPEIIAAAEGLDLVGLYASGRLYRGFANSLGQRNWYSAANFNFDWTCYHQTDKAVKSRYAGSEWSSKRLDQKLEHVRTELRSMQRPALTLRPGRYRAYLAPEAVAEILSTVAWGGFSLKSHRTRQTPLIKLAQGARSLDPRVRLSENSAAGIAPRFTDRGFITPKEIVLIDGGRHAGCLVDSRSAKEYQMPVNAASEYPRSLDLGAGTIEPDDVLSTLDTGIYINNLWYTNFSDRNECRITGMTRYACFWVENGRIKAPIEVMRFDESLYPMLGEHLLGITSEREWIPDSDTYEHRSIGHMHLPGLLIDRFALTL
jgi:predicted Zn-dependent protease